MPKIFVSTAPFGVFDRRPLDLLEATGWDIKFNQTGRKLTAEEVAEHAADCDGLIAGTENIARVLEKANNLKIIARVGIGLDSVPLAYCRDHGIAVSYTPDAVTMAVVELTLGLMIATTRHVVRADRNLRKGEWERLQGKRIGLSKVGIIGLGRVGSRVALGLAAFKPKEILINDLKDKTGLVQQLQGMGLKARLAEKDEIYAQADIVSLHLPLSNTTKQLIGKEELARFSPEGFLINTARGGIVDELALYNAIRDKCLAGAAVDVFSEEPYHGPLCELEEVVLTQHMGSCSFDCRAAMELESTEEVIRFFNGEPLKQPVPPEEYEAQA